MDDYIARIVSPEHIRDWTVAANVISAFFIGPYLAFAATPDAGFRCLQALIRMAHRVVLVVFAIALMNNAAVIASGVYIPHGAVLGVNICILMSVLISAMRYHYWMSDIPKNASWAHPHLPHRKTDAQAATEATARHNDRQKRAAARG